jgi:hypothetical protein
MKEHILIWSAIHELKIDVPVMRYEIVGAEGLSPTITLFLYGGQVVTWSPKPVGVDGIDPAPKPVGVDGIDPAPKKSQRPSK